MATYSSIAHNFTPPAANIGAMTLISEQTASASASISFTSGIDSTYRTYKFRYVNLHPSVDNNTFLFNLSADGGSNYNVTKTTTHWRAIHGEGDSPATINYNTSDDIAQGTGFQNLYGGSGADNDQAICGELWLFNPSSTTFVKHFYGVSQGTHSENYSINNFVNGYANTTSAINAIQFKFASGNIDAGTIALYGIA
tara:strand:+ start:966 stop:1556 length:591 start_codon:yes stop_codon:yes gene_type:complete